MHGEMAVIGGQHNETMQCDMDKIKEALQNAIVNRNSFLLDNFILKEFNDDWGALFSRIQFCTTLTEMREVAARICRNYLHGAWKVVKPEELEFRRISGGLSNYLYYLALPDDASKLSKQLMLCEKPQSEMNNFMDRNMADRYSEPKKVLLRIYGHQYGARNMDSVVTQSVIFTLLSERKLGPKLHGVFSGGRIEEFIPGRPLITRELPDPMYSRAIAQNMATVHQMNVPMTKEPTWIWTQMSEWFKIADANLSFENMLTKPDDVQTIMTSLRRINFEAEIEWLKTYIMKVDSPVVFCHNDMQEGNILLLEEKPESNENPFRTFSDNEPKLVLIDYEYCAYNYRGFDIANHFQEWVYEYTNQEPPYFHVSREDAPTLEQREYFIREYLIHFYKDTGYKYKDEDFNRIDEEVKVFTMVSHLFWALWSMKNGNETEIRFAYWEYAMERYECYLEMKNYKEIRY